MDHSLKAEDVLPLIRRLSTDERLRLIRLAQLKQNPGDDERAYAVLPVREGEFSSDEDLLGWDSEGWENIE
jgi:hypothetical protein